MIENFTERLYSWTFHLNLSSVEHENHSLFPADRKNSHEMYDTPNIYVKRHKFDRKFYGKFSEKLKFLHHTSPTLNIISV